MNPDEVARLVSEIKGNPAEKEKLRKLEEINAEALTRILELQADMASIQKSLIRLNRDHHKSKKILEAWGANERGLDLRIEGRCQESLEAFNLTEAANPRGGLRLLISVEF